MRGQSGFFDVDERLKRLSDLGDQFYAPERHWRDGLVRVVGISQFFG
jgi:hypothetical protein